MKIRDVLFFLVALLFWGCGSSFQGIRMRAESPPIEEAFRKLSLAVTADQYEFDQVDPANFFFSTRWRPLKPAEHPDRENAGNSPVASEVKISLNLHRRGSVYDVLLDLSLKNPDGKPVQLNPPTRLTDKWMRILSDLIQKETKSQD